MPKPTEASQKTTPVYDVKRTVEAVMVVDDDKLVLAALGETLRREGYEVFEAKNGAEALTIIEKTPIALVICDQRMPGLSGVEVLHNIKNLSPDTIRILLTGNGDEETAIQAINIGQVSQYIEKPWDDTFLRQTVKSHIEKYRLIKENEQLQQMILTQHHKLEHAHAALQHDLQLGARIHEQLLAGNIPESLPGFDIAAISIPSKQIDGDFYEFCSPVPEVLDLVIGDVMGKGIPAALVGTALKTQFLHYAAPSLIAKVYDQYHLWADDLLSPEEILASVHRTMVSKLIHIEYFSSLFYGRFDLRRQTFTFVDCGSPKPMHYSAKKKNITPLKGENFPLGIVKDTEYQSHRTSYGAGDCFVFFSDGVTESRSPEGELFGTDRIQHILSQYVETNAAKILHTIRESVMRFTQKEFLDDDLTLIIVKINECITPKPDKEIVAKFSSSLSQAKAARDFIRNTCLKAPGDPEKLGTHLQLAINEIFCNIVKHSYQQRSDGAIVITANLKSDGIWIEVSDQGEPFDPSSVEEPSFLGDKETGFGWYMIRKIADHMTYRHKGTEGGWNHLSIFKRYYSEEETMNVIHKRHNDIIIITPESDSLDAKIAPEFKNTVLELISNYESTKVVFDLHHLEFVDSSGLGTFLSVLRTLHTQNGDLKLACMSSSIRAMFELVSMHKIFEIFNTTDDAVKSFK